ncbi:hypothetical protein BD309DRAFT_878286 [Dichomitus squalens]|uniref:Uncharacterized protein n=1 Tax=Dichomitus squalens TaxID=114155 RepID=A0A4Q9PG23_9APHY|nr:hypothetical protein BD309DRAFT_878286 [Dichomitus squalens]TBU53878.1 hypothetical protein BD310DRAFT_951775 [Dichomitus squalens]
MSTDSHARTASDSSSLTSLSDRLSSSHIQDPPQPPPRQQPQTPPRKPAAPNPQSPPNVDDEPDLVHSLSSSDPASPTSTRSFGLFSEFPGLGESVEELIYNSMLDDNTLYARAQKHLEFLRNFPLSYYNTPEWMQTYRTPQGERGKKLFSVLNFISAMYDTASELKLKGGKRYVSAAICACANGARASTNLDVKSEALAQRLSDLASTWVAFLLWPFYANAQPDFPGRQQHNENATPTFKETATLVDRGLCSAGWFPEREGKSILTYSVPQIFTQV